LKKKLTFKKEKTPALNHFFLSSLGFSLSLAPSALISEERCPSTPGEATARARRTSLPVSPLSKRKKGKKEEEKEGDKNGNPLNASRVDSPALSRFLPSLSLAPHAIVSSMPSKVASN